MILRFLYRNYLSLALLFAAAGPAMAAGTQAGSLEISVKAAFLPKFAAYVNWPPSVMGAPDDPLQLCVIGRDPFGPRLDEAASRQHIDQHPILVRHLENTEGAEQRSEEHTSDLQSLMRISYAVFCLKKKTKRN